MNFKRGEYRNKKFTKFCHTIPCQIGSPCCTDGETVPAHSNAADDGKGRGIKADDIFCAAACHACHDFVDRRGNEWCNHSAEEIQWYHDRGIKRTIRLALDAGVIK
jgi:hypothetical protein